MRFGPTDDNRTITWTELKANNEVFKMAKAKRSLDKYHQSRKERVNILIATQKEFNPKSIILESKIKEERVKGMEEDQELCG